MRDDLKHGGALDRMRTAFPQAPEPWMDLSTGINPWAYPVGDVPEAAFHHLPTLAAHEQCHEAMARAMGALPESLVLSPGSELLIRLLPDIIRPGRVAVLSPSYGDHAAAWRATGCEVIETGDPLAEADRADAIVVCNPNNPDGRRFQPEALLAAARRLANGGGWLIVDEAYGDLEPGLSLAPWSGTDGLIILRSFGKFFGLAGVRLGGMLAPPVVREGVQARLGVWPVAGPALDIGARAYADLAWQAMTRSKLSEAARRLDAIIEESGLERAGGTGLFCLIETEDATALWERLARQGIYVRRFDWSERFVRLGLPEDREAEARLARALSP